VAILVIAVGALKSTADLLGTKGLPLVFSVLSFGLAAATQSITLSRWQKASSTPAAESRDPVGARSPEASERMEKGRG
jgi:hypothetical protein